MAQSQLYNNPAFASGLGDVLQAMLAPKDAPAAAQYDAQRAGMLADTRNYRLGLGQAGEGGDYANMMIRALQAGRDYSAEAPEITAAIASLPGSGFSAQDMANIQVGSGVQRASGTFAGRGGTGGAPSGGKLTAGGRSLIIRALGDVDPSVSMAAVLSAENAISGGMGENEAINFALQPPAEPVVPADPDNLPGTVISRFLGPDVDYGQIGQPSTIAPAPINPSQRVIGTQYQAPNGNVATWTANGWAP